MDRTLKQHSCVLTSPCHGLKDNEYNEDFRKRSRPSSRMGDFKALCNDINTLGETPKKYSEDVEFMTTPIVKNFESDDFRKAVLQTLFGVVTEQPQKMLHIAGLVQSVYVQSASVGRMIVEFFHQEAQVILEKAVSKSIKPSSSDTGPWNNVKLILRFWSCLAFILDTQSVSNVFTQLLKLSIGLQDASPDSRCPLAEAIYYNTLISVPYFHPFITDKTEYGTVVNGLIETAKGFKPVPSNVTITKPFSEQSTEQPFEPKEVVALVLESLNSFVSNDVRLFLDIRTQLGTLLTPTDKMELPPLKLPTIEELKEISGLDSGLGSVDGMWRTPRFTMEVYPPIGDLQTTPPSDSFVGLILRDIVTDIIEALEFNRKEVARQIITLDLFFNDNIFAPPGSSIDSLKKLQENNIENGTSFSTWKIEDIAIETLLGLMFKLPTASQPSVYFYTTLVEACSNAPQAIAQVIGRAIRFFYRNVYHLDFELTLRYLDWLSIQLSNFNFTWKWNEWENDGVRFADSKYNPRVVFIRNLVAKELRLGSYERISQTLTPQLQRYLDLSLFNASELRSFYGRVTDKDDLAEDAMNVLYVCDKLPLKPYVEKLIEVIHTNQQPQNLQQAIEELKTVTEPFTNGEELLITIVFQAIAFVGSKSTSHVAKCIDSTRDQLKNLLSPSSDEMDDEQKALEKQVWAVGAVLSYWNQDPHCGYLAVDVLENFGVVSPLAVLKHSLDDSRDVNIGLVNVATIESIFRSLTRVVFSGSSTKELIYVFETLLKTISKTCQVLTQSEAIPIPDVEADVTEEVELSWKYHTTLGFVRAVLRKFSDEYTSVSNLVDVLEKEVSHEDTKRVIRLWIENLSGL
ncbi:GCR3 [Cyberlindnera jadinii]|uniref:GCR3 protein n=1 Tax=Cyberlindnera jadinii (strain ATCC 18201 / CBS 1600 / BCRC 20928 / JCM 3617 / NBRC 0987 / NRRL Y-1542) TaxID=983966 RepID=A0A0H5C952_CYBJN|nr:GCR3 [Cyberlindnera jadinii]